MVTLQKDIQLYRTNAQQITWKVPAFFCNDWAAVRLLQICSQLSERPAFDIVYGSPRCAWSGGRPSAINQTLEEEQLIEYVRTYKELGAICAFTLSRLNVPKADYADPYCNQILDIIEEYEGEAIIYDDGLAHYVRSTHPKIKTVASLNKAMCDFKDSFSGHKDETAYYFDLLEDYDIVVIRCEFASDDEKLEALSDVKDRIEIIVNQFCTPNCMHVYKHLEAIEEWNNGDQRSFCQPCFHLDTLSVMENRLRLNLFMSDSRISELAGLGFKRMKLAGRNSILPKFLDMVSHYIFEPTGAISIIGNQIIREFRLISTGTNLNIQQYQLPDPEAIRLVAG